MQNDEVSQSESLPFNERSAARPNPAEERVVWEARPSVVSRLPSIVKWLALGAVFYGLYFLLTTWHQYHYLDQFVFSVRNAANNAVSVLMRVYADMVFLALAGIAALRVVQLIWICRVTHYRLTNERLKVSRGFFVKRINEVELYRIMDYELHLPLYQRIFFRGNIVLLTADRSCPRVVLEGVPKYTDLRTQIRTLAFDRRRSGVGMVEALR